MENKTLGQKIEYYRKRVKMSQLDLEIEIGAGQGSLSRIENGQVNPTKETIVKLIEVLNLIPSEASDLFTIDISSEIDKYIEIAKTLSSLPTLESVLNLITTDLISYIDGKYAVIFLKDEKLNNFNVASLNVPELVRTVCEGFVGYDLDKVQFDLEDEEDRKNFYVKSYIDETFTQTNNVYEASYPLLSKKIADAAQKIADVKLIISMPINFKNKKLGVLGIVLAKSAVDSYDKKMIANFNELISSTIYRFKIHGK